MSLTKTDQTTYTCPMHPDDPGTAGAPGRHDDDDLYTRTEPGWAWRKNFTRWDIAMSRPHVYEQLMRQGFVPGYAAVQMF